MSTVAVTQVIDAPPARVWAVLTDLSRRACWLSSVDGVEVASSGTLDAGTMWRETRTVADGTRVTEEFRVDECRPPRLLVVLSPEMGADYRLTYRLTPIDVGRHRGGTAVTVVQEDHSNGPAGRVLELMLGGLAARAVEGALRQELADLSEAVRASGAERSAA